jgi:putative transposase
MTRPLRIQYPDAWYHVMNRGRHGESIYEDVQDYIVFIDLLKEAGSMEGKGVRKGQVCR